MLEDSEPIGIENAYRLVDIFLKEIEDFQMQLGALRSRRERENYSRILDSEDDVKGRYEDGY